MFVVLVDFKVKEEFISSFRSALLKQAENSLSKEADCHQFDVCCDPEDQTLFTLYELYTDPPSFQEHLTSSHFLKFDKTIRDWVIDKSVRTLSLVSR
ncbi:putative quinol monooxygenase [Sneathiella sp. HT1-7]|jgi:quinol monooxygenase YgiN|uniref:putative quinol monooxygenase n=1 Tax=Sneathiella sp. HT1-7 TaxID=2887192 RepID=UPI001D143A3C|nr:putative quinol monooxygenase [Sneathiella sp. HT1-7]MCC3306335.1 antibiotic biosynthesis monooxygenase [Sneathiella sp. HT1-7]